MLHERPTTSLLVSIVIPVFNNAESIPLLLDRLQRQIMEFPSTLQFEVILIDDGSKDDSWEHIVRAKSDQSGLIVGVKLSRNFGQLAAMIAGWEIARGDAVINMSADLQDPPELIRDLIQAWQAGGDLVMGVRERREDGAVARLTSRLAHKVVRSSYPEMPDTWFDFTLISKRVLEVVKSMEGRFRFSQGDMLYAGFNRISVPYIRAKRPFGKSGYNFWSRLKNFTDTVLDSSYLLIQFFIRLGVLVSASSLIYAAWIIVARVFGWLPSSGWAPIMIVLLVTSGIIMIMLGIIAEYLWRIYDSSRNKPVYVVEAVL